MDDLRDKVKGGRSLMEKIGRIIPGYSGYKNKLERQEADKLLRDFIVSKLDLQSENIKNLIDELQRGMKMKHLTRADGSLKKLEKYRDRIKFANHGYSGLFEPVKVDTAVLDKMYDFDNSLIEVADQINKNINAILANIDDDDALKMGLDTLYQLITDSDNFYGKREEIVLGNN